jgi:RNA polymerase sigma factor (sigma-70 family)
MDATGIEREVDRVEGDVSSVKAESAFEPFFETEYPRLVKALYLTTGDLPEAEELAQESMARAFERWDRVSSMESPGGYVFRTAINLNAKRLRHLRIVARRLLRPSTPRDETAAAVARSDLLRELATLPLGLRQALVLTDWLEMTSEEAAKVLGIRPASVRSRTHRAREVLHSRLEVSDG